MCVVGASNRYCIETKRELKPTPMPAGRVWKLAAPDARSGLVNQPERATPDPISPRPISREGLNRIWRRHRGHHRLSSVLSRSGEGCTATAGLRAVGRDRRGADYDLILARRTPAECSVGYNGQILFRVSTYPSSGLGCYGSCAVRSVCLSVCVSGCVLFGVSLRCRRRGASTCYYRVTLYTPSLLAFPPSHTSATSSQCQWCGCSRGWCCWSLL